MTNECQADPSDVAACAIDGCTYSDPEGFLARGGIKRLREFLTANPEPPGSDGYGCGCRKCTGFERPLSADDVEKVLAHVSPRLATLYAIGKVDLHSTECEGCWEIAPHFSDSAGSAAGALARRRCPYHDHLLMVVDCP